MRYEIIIKGLFFNNFHLNRIQDDLYTKNENITQVKCMTLDALVEKHNVVKIDYLKIDAELTDHEILLSYSWKIKPTVIKAETMHWYQLFKSGTVK